MPHARDDSACRGGLAGLHAGAGQRDHRHPAGVERRAGVEWLVADAGRHADALAQVGEVEGHAEHAAVERTALLGVDRVAYAEHAADVQHLNDIARLELLGHMPRVAEQRLAMAERARDHIALADLGHAAAGELERVVGRFVGEHLHHDHHTFLGGNVRRDPYLMRESAGLSDRGQLVDHDAAHALHAHSSVPPAARSPARAWNTPGSATIREKPSASLADHSPAASPYTPLDAAMSDQGDSTPAMNTLPGCSTRCTSPVTRCCEDNSSASMSRHTGSSSCPSCTRSPYGCATSSLMRCWRPVSTSFSSSRCAVSSTSAAGASKATRPLVPMMVSPR